MVLAPSFVVEVLGGANAEELTVVVSLDVAESVASYPFFEWRPTRSLRLSVLPEPLLAALLPVVLLNRGEVSALLITMVGLKMMLWRGLVGSHRPGAGGIKNDVITR